MWSWLLFTTACTLCTPSDELGRFYNEVSRVLVSEGSFAFLKKHPVFGLQSYCAAFQTNATAFDYFADWGKYFRTTLQTVTGETLTTGTFHSTFEDHSTALKNAGLCLTEIVEPVCPVGLRDVHSMFEPLVGKVVYVIFVGQKRI